MYCRVFHVLRHQAGQPISLLDLTSLTYDITGKEYYAVQQALGITAKRTGLRIHVRHQPGLAQTVYWVDPASSRSVAALLAQRTRLGRKRAEAAAAASHSKRPIGAPIAPDGSTTSAS